MNDTPLSVADTRSRLRRLRDRLRPYRNWLLFVGGPTFLAVLYYGVIAADLYASEARFVVRSPSRIQAPGLAGLLQTASMGGRDDVYTVQDFATSRDAVDALQKKVDLKALFSRPEADWVSQYPNLIDDRSAEDFYRYYKRRVQMVFDTTTGISTLTVKAFRAADAQKVAELLLEESEALVNRLNTRARENAVRDAEADLRRAQDEAEKAESEVLAYRNRNSLLNPGETSSAVFKTLASLQAEVATARVRASELVKRSPDSPLRAELESRIAALEQQIEREKARLAGGNGSMAPKISEYEMLQLRQTFAAKQLGSALASLESSQSEARRQQIYLDRVVEPNLPDKALYPQRLRSIFIVFVSCALIYSIAALLLAGVREHAQQ